MKNAMDARVKEVTGREVLALVIGLAVVIAIGVYLHYSLLAVGGVIMYVAFWFFAFRKNPGRTPPPKDVDTDQNVSFPHPDGPASRGTFGPH